MTDRNHKLSITRQAKLLDISCGSVYDQPKPVSPAALALMNRIDHLHLDYPYLLRKLTITRPNQVWAMDITHIPMAPWLCVSGGGGGLAHTPSVDLEALHNHGRALLHGCRGGGASKVWGSRDHEHRPRQPVHQPSVHSNAEG